MFIQERVQDTISVDTAVVCIQCHVEVKVKKQKKVSILYKTENTEETSNFIYSLAALLLTKAP